MSSSNNHSHIEYLDGVRVLSAFFVVLIHASSARISKFSELEVPEWMSALYLNVFIQSPVPIFIVISGYLVFKSTKKINFVDYYQKRAFRIIPALLFWSAFYFFWVTWQYGVPFNLNTAITEFSLGMPNTVYYFLFIILGLYIVAPFFKWILDKSKTAFALTTFTFTLLTLSGAIYLIEVNAITYFLAYICFFLLGAYAGSYQSNIWLTIISLIAIIITGLLIADGTYNNYSTMAADDYRLEEFMETQHIYPFIQSVATFIFLRHLFELIPTGSKQANFLKVITPATFGVYLMHVFFLDLIRTFFHTYNANNVAFDIVFESVIAFTLSLLLSLLLLRIKYINKLIS